MLLIRRLAFQFAKDRAIGALDKLVKLLYGIFFQFDQIISEIDFDI